MTWSRVRAPPRWRRTRTPTCPSTGWWPSWPARATSSRTPVFQAMFRLDLASVALDLAGLEVSPFEVGHRTAQVDLTLEVSWGEGGAWRSSSTTPTCSSPRPSARWRVTWSTCSRSPAPYRTRAFPSSASLRRRRGGTPRGRAGATHHGRFGRPRGAMETALAEIWRDALGVARTDGAAIGTGNGRGVGFMSVVFGLVMAASSPARRPIRPRFPLRRRGAGRHRGRPHRPAGTPATPRARRADSRMSHT